MTHDSNNSNCPLNDPETYCNPVLSGLDCTCKSKRIADEEIIKLIQNCTIEVDLVTAEVRMRGTILKPYEIGAEESNRNHTRFAFGLRVNGRRRTIVRAKLVYLAGSLRPIPEGFEIHHMDEDRFNDAYANLIALSKEDHLKLHRWLEGRAEVEDVPF